MMIQEPEKANIRTRQRSQVRQFPFLHENDSIIYAFITSCHIKEKVQTMIQEPEKANIRTWQQSLVW